MPFLSLTSYSSQTPDSFIHTPLPATTVHNEINSLFNQISTLYQSNYTPDKLTNGHEINPATAEPSRVVPLCAARFNLPEHLRAAYGTCASHRNGEKNYISIGQDSYQVHFAVADASWRIYCDGNPAKPSLPVVYQDGRWQLTNRNVGLPGGHPANLPEPVRTLYKVSLPLNDAEKKIAIVHYQGKYYLGIGDDHYWLKRTDKEQWLICSQTDSSAKPIPIVWQNNQWQLALKITDTDKVFANFSGYKQFRHWFHLTVNTLSLLAARHPVNGQALTISTTKQQALVKFVLKCFHMQATYSSQDILRLGRQTSPLATNFAYSRANATRLWQIVHDVKEQQLDKAFREVQEKALQPPVPVAEEFNIFPASRPFPYRNGLLPEIVATVPLDLNQKKMLYITSLGIQLFKASSRQLKFSEGNSVDSFIALRGLRMSPNECADVLAQEMVGFIEAGQIDAARKILTDFFYYKKYAALADSFTKIELASNALMAPVDVDPLTETGPHELQALYNLYHQCCNVDKSSLTFYARQNMAVVQNLIGPDPAVFFTQFTPAFITAEFSDGLQTTYDRMVQLKNEKQAPSVIEGALRMEQFYQTMQHLHHLIRFQLSWNESCVSLEDTVKQLLPANMRASACVIVGPHGLAVFEKIYQALPVDMQKNAAFLPGAYFETPALLPGAEKVATVDARSLQKKELIVLEPHPNNASIDSIIPHCPVTLIRHVFAGPLPMQRTILVDATASHLTEADISYLLTVAKPLIDRGHLNLILLQSGTKLFQHGMDIVSIGVAVILNNNRDIWTGFNDAIQQNPQPVPEDDRAYIARMLAPENMPCLQDYLTRIRQNTAMLRAQLESVMVLGHNNHHALELCNNTDPQTVYIALKPTDRFIALQTGVSDPAAISYLDRITVSEVLYDKYLLSFFKELTAVERQSFGFNITTFALCDEGIRVTLGIEESYLIKEYASRIMALSYTLYSKGLIADYFYS